MSDVTASEAFKLAMDRTLYGVSFQTVDGKRIDPLSVRPVRTTLNFRPVLTVHHYGGPKHGTKTIMHVDDVSLGISPA